MALRFSEKTVKIVETEEGWSVLGDGIYGAASEALNHIMAEARELSDRNNISVVTRIEWEPNTRVGRQIVRALTSKS